MGPGAEAFTMLAILEARDRASEIFEKCGAAAEKFGETTRAVADEAYESGAKIDEALGRDVSAADRLEVAAGRVAAAQAQARESAVTLTAAENELRAAQTEAAAAGNEDAGAQERLIAASKAVSAAQKDAAASAKAVKDAQVSEGAALRSSAAAGDENAAAQLKTRDASEESAASLGKIGKLAGLTALGLGVAAAVMVKAAGNFQSSTAHLVTDAGESAQNLGMVRAGILNVSTATGTSASAITDAMYHIESAGQHGAAGLGVLRIAAEGAKVGNADLDTTAKTLVGTLVSYGMASSNSGTETKNATKLMNELIATVGSGDMRMQDLAASLGNVTPVAAAAGISFSQVGGAIATMTSQNMSAQQASQDLSNTIRSLENPSAEATAEMAQLGLNSQAVASQLGRKGLTGTVQELTAAITGHMGKSGQVMMSAFNQSTAAAQDAQVMLRSMPASIQGVAKAYLSGALTSQQWTTDLKGMTPLQKNLASQFATTADKAHGFNDLLKSGSPSAQTYTAALRRLTGNATAMNTVMMLSGTNLSAFKKNADAVAGAAAKSGSSVTNWATIQGTFNQKIDVAKTAVENTGIAIGSALLPAVSAIIGAVGKVLIPVAEWTAKNKTLTLVLFGGATALAALVATVALASKAFKAVKGAVDTVKSAVSGAVGLMKKLGGQSKATAGTQAKSAQEAASAEETAAAESAEVQEEKAGEAAAAQEEAAAGSAAAQEEAAASSSAGWIAAAASTVAGWAATGAKMVAQAAVWVAANTAKVAVVVASNLAGAAVTAAAWVAANAVMLLGIGLVIAAVVIAVVEIVKHWHSIVDGVKDAWNAVYDFISKIISDVVNFVKSHWVLILGALTGPVGLAVAYVVTHFTQVKAFVSKIVSDVISFVRDHWRLIVSVLGGPLGLAVALVTRYWGDIKHWFSEGTSKVLSVLRGLAHDVVSVGEDVVRGIWRGISGMGGWLWGQVKSFASNTLHSFESALGIGSPSKYTTVHGQMLGLGLANGILSTAGKVAAASRSMAAAALTGTSSLASRSSAGAISSGLAATAIAPAGGYGGSGGITIIIDVHGNTVMSDADADKLAAKLGKRLATVRLPASGTRLTIR